MAESNQIRINELARELEVKAKAILESLPIVGFTGKKTHSSSLDLETAEKVRKYIRAAAEGGQPEAPKAPAAVPVAALPAVAAPPPVPVAAELPAVPDASLPVAKPAPPAGPAIVLAGEPRVPGLPARPVAPATTTGAVPSVRTAGTPLVVRPAVPSRIPAKPGVPPGEAPGRVTARPGETPVRPAAALEAPARTPLVPAKKLPLPTLPQRAMLGGAPAKESSTGRTAPRPPQKPPIPGTTGSGRPSQPRGPRLGAASAAGDRAATKPSIGKPLYERKPAARARP